MLIVSLDLVPVTYDDACAFIEEHHRTHPPPQGWKYGTAVARDDEVVGVLVAGRPVNRSMDDGWTPEFTRVCVRDGPGTKNVGSKLRGAGIRAAWALGYRRVIEYTTEDQEGSSLKAVGFREVRKSPGGSWDREDRPRVDRHPTGQKRLWEVEAP